MNLLLWLVLPYLAFAGSPWDGILAKKLACEKNGKLRFTFKGRPIEEASAYCFQSGGAYFLSKSCYKGGNCVALQADLCQVGPEVFSGAAGSPGQKLCQAIGAFPQTLEFYDGKKWQPISRCYFRQDGSYLDPGLLLALRGNCPKPAARSQAL